MGSKGQSTQDTNNNQSYTADPRTQQAASQALTGAENAASQPFQMPVAPVAGFNPQQQQAFNQYSQIQGANQGLNDQAAQYTAMAANPITGADVANYYNPMASNVTAQLQNIYGQQNSQNQGQLTSQAGGVGADRIAVGMGNLANQQGLASGQIYSNLYQNALQAAEQQKQMAAGAGAGFGNLANQTQTEALQATGALGASGLQQQQQTQAQLNAPYQNQLAQIAYQFQTPQYLAGIAGGLAPALGGTTLGGQNTTSTPAQPSIFSQLLGAGTAGVGLYNGLNSGTGSGKGSNTGAINNSMNTLNNGTGGSYYGPGFAEGGATDDSGPAIPGVTLPKSGGMEPIPMVSMPMGAGHSGPLTGGINFPQAQQQQGTGESIGGDIGSALKTAAAILPFLKRGGPVQRFDDGGDVSDGGYNKIDDASNNPISNAAIPSWKEMMSHFTSPPIPAKSGQNYSWGQLGNSLSDRFSAAFPQSGKSAPAQTPAAAASPTDEFSNPHPVPAGGTPTPMPYPGPGALGAKTDAVRINPPGKPAADEEEAPAGAALTAGKGKPAAAATDATGPYMMPRGQQPYPNATYMDKGQEFAKSPWMALVKAGATMMSTPGSFGTGLGKGILAGAGSVDSQRKELRSEQELNDKAQKLYQEAQIHLDKYNKMTPFEEGSLKARNKEIDQAAETGGAGGPKEVDVQRAAKPLYDSIDPVYMKMPPDEKRALAIHALKHGTYIGAEHPFPDGKGGTVLGVWDGQKWGPK
jgi:hypothetical protein